MLLGDALLLFLIEFFVLCRHEASPSHSGLDEAVPLEVFIGFLDGDDADVDGLRQGPHGGDGVPRLELAAHYHGLDLGCNLFVNRFVGIVADNDFHAHSFHAFWRCRSGGFRIGKKSCRVP